jgi:hypothetical protein
MKLDQTKLHIIGDGATEGNIEYVYQLNREDSENLTPLRQAFFSLKNDEFIVGVRSKSLTEQNIITTLEATVKKFQANSDGFEEATKYFEELIFASEKKNQESQPQKPNPIGIFCKLSGRDSDRIILQDGRKTELIQVGDEAIIEKNVLKWQRDMNYADTGVLFKEGESFYIDTMPNANDCYALYPTGDLEQIQQQAGEGEQTVNREINVDEGEVLPNPVRLERQEEGENGGLPPDGGLPPPDGGFPPPDGGLPPDGELPTDGENGEDDENGGNGDFPINVKDIKQKLADSYNNGDFPINVKDIKQKLADSYNFTNFRSLMDFYRTEDELFAEMLTYSKEEVEAMMKNLDLPETTTIEQLRSILQ